MRQNPTAAPTRATPPPPQPPRPRRWRRLAMVLVTVLALLAGAVLYGAYGYLPAEAGRSYSRTTPTRSRRALLTRPSPASTTCTPATARR